MKGDTNLTIIFVYVKETTVMPIFPMQNILFHVGDIKYLFLYTQGFIHSKYDIVLCVFSMFFFVLLSFGTKGQRHSDKRTFKYLRSTPVHQ